MTESMMAREAAETPAGARVQIASCRAILDELGARLRERPPAFVVTSARGSSDHAATYGKYLIELAAGRAVASIGPSIVSMYGRAPDLSGALVITVSQSGRSPDLVQLATAARARGALVVGIINDTSSPLAAACEIVLPICAGPERAVAATKSFLLSGLAFLQLVTAWTGDPSLHEAVTRAPDWLVAAAELDGGLAPLVPATSVYVLGRGLGLGAAMEIALKLKETCRLHGEAFSPAELWHGPIALVEPGFPILALGHDDATAPSMRDAIAHLATLGANVIPIPAVPDVPAVLAPLCLVQTAYRAIPALAVARGLDPDQPRHLHKITETI